MNANIVLATILGLVGLWYFLSSRWPEYRLDSFRDDIFRLRDKMFMFAAEENISFQHPAYTILRERMNVLIRYAHEFKLTRFLIAVTVLDLSKPPALVKWEEAVTELPGETRRQMEHFNESLAFIVVKQLFFSSFLLYLILRPIVAIVKTLDVDVRKEVLNRPEVVARVEAYESKALDQDALAGRARAAAATA